MPVTARLSQKFYERLGEDVANELVDWFNAVDATYRNDLRELNELNFQGFDAKVEQRFAQADAKWEQRFAQADARWEQRFAELRVEIERRFAETKTEFATIRRALADQRADVVRWMFRFWIGTLVPLAGLIVALRVL
jgi:hypothetical protein